MSVWSRTDIPFCSCVATQMYSKELLGRAHHTNMMFYDIKAVPSAKCLIFKESFFRKQNISYEYFFMSHSVCGRKEYLFHRALKEKY